MGRRARWIAARSGLLYSPTWDAAERGTAPGIPLEDPLGSSISAALRCIVALSLAALLPAGRIDARERDAAPRVQPLAATRMWTSGADTPVRSHPAGALLTRLDVDQEVRATGVVLAGGVRWIRLRLWGALDAWVRADLLAGAPIPVRAPGGGDVAPHPIGPHAPMALHARGATDEWLHLRALPDAGSPSRRLLPPGTSIAIDAWATDAAGQAWYRLAAPRAGWVSAGSVNLAHGTGRANLRPVDGFGMWCTPDVLAVAPPEALIAAARAGHVTHLYLEVGRSNTGFYGAGILARLLPVAHRAGIAVIAWVYPFLDDVPADVATALAAARYVAPSGDRPDALMADLEQNMQEAYVRAYSQILRARLGPRYLMGVATYPPQSYWGRRYPFRTVARSWDLIVPMDYWHLEQRAYTPGEAAAYVAASIDGVRAATGSRAVPIEVLGQMFDWRQDGRGSPSGAEIGAAIGAAAAGGAGVSFFEWNHASPGEWDVLRAWGAPGSGDARAPSSFGDRGMRAGAHYAVQWVR